MKYFALIALFLIGCSEADHPMVDFSKLEGEWMYKSNGDQVIEKWEKVSDDLFIGNSYVIQEEDSIKIEGVRLHRSNGVWVYAVSVLNQNNGEEIPFKLTEKSMENYLFENPSHDFPKQIRYHIRNDSLIEVSIKGGEKSAGFTLVKQH